MKLFNFKALTVCFLGMSFFRNVTVYSNCHLSEYTSLLVRVYDKYYNVSIMKVNNV